MIWTAPREFDDTRCIFVLAGGSSLQLDMISKLQGPIIAIKHCGELRLDADVLFISGKDAVSRHKDLLAKFKGRYVVRRGLYPETWAGLNTIARLGADPDGKAQLSDDPTKVGGFCTGASAINLAYLMGRPANGWRGQPGGAPIVLLGFDMHGSHWVKDHRNLNPKQAEFDRHIAGLATMAVALKAKGARVVNCSPGSALTCFENGELADWL